MRTIGQEQRPRAVQMPRQPITTPQMETDAILVQPDDRHMRNAGTIRRFRKQRAEAMRSDKGAHRVMILPAELAIGMQRPSPA